MNIIILLINIVLSLSIGDKDPQYTNVDSRQFRSLIENDHGSLLDVRTRSEFANGHIDGAGQLNFYSLDFKKKLFLLPKDQPVYLYCNTGFRSSIAAKILSESGYNQVYNLEKGIMEWELLNNQVVIEPDAKPDTQDKMEPDEFNALINGKDPVLIDFYAPWCAPCRSMMPMVDKLREEYSGKTRIVKINADASKKLIKAQKVGSVPYFVLYSNGEVLFQHEGVLDEESIRRELDKVR